MVGAGQGPADPASRVLEEPGATDVSYLIFSPENVRAGSFPELKILKR
jgi:hypothetical protein